MRKGAPPCLDHAGRPWAHQSLPTVFMEGGLAPIRSAHKVRMNTQCARVLDYMKRNGSIEPLQAWQEIGVYRLASRISELRLDHNIPIAKQMVKTENQFGEPVRFARYSLEAA